MNNLFIILIILITILIILSIILLFILLRRQKDKGEEGKSFLMLQNQMNELSKILDTKLGESTKAIQIQFGQSAKIISDVTEKLTKLDETNKQVINFADQLQSLQDILKNPKQRGVLGEFYLETVLKNVLPPNTYRMQYSFSDGTIVDAAIFIDSKIIPIDSKFSLENYNKILQEKNEKEREKLEKLFRQDLKNRIDETSKYIKPEENTMDFAFMFIPAEAVYYDLLINKVGSVNISSRDLIEYAFSDKHVIIVSPTSFFAYLQTVLQGLRALKIEKEAEEIRKRVEDLSKHILNYEEYLKKLGSQMSTVVNTYNAAYKEFGKIDKDVVRISGADREAVEPKEIERPKSKEE